MPITSLAPHVSGTIAIRSSTAAFLQAFQRRVGAGLLAGKRHPRSNYRVTKVAADRLHVRAEDWWTAMNVGLNELDLCVAQRGSVRYDVRYWRWAAYAFALSGSLGLIGLVLLLTLDVRTYIARHPERMIPGLSVDGNLSIAWAMVIFWGAVWPWLLIVLHKRPLRRLVERLVAEVDASLPAA